MSAQRMSLGILHMTEVTDAQGCGTVNRVTILTDRNGNPKVCL